MFKKIKILNPPAKRISIYLVAGIILYINLILMECYFNDRKIIVELKKKGFYEDVIFAEYDKGVVASAYLGYSVRELGSGHVISAIDATRKAFHLYPPCREGCFEHFYEIYTKFPRQFEEEFIKNSDAFDRLELSLKFYEKGDLDNSKYYFKQALKLKPDISELAKKQKNSYLTTRLDKAFDFLARLKKEFIGHE